MSNKEFAEHLYDPLRQEIAIRYAQHEYRKMFSDLRDKETWKIVDRQIKQWPNTYDIRKFYNSIHGISMGWGSKELVPYITSLNIHWEKKEVPINDIWFAEFGPVASMGAPKGNIQEVQQKLFDTENKEVLTDTKQRLEEESQKTVPRDADPIFTIWKEEKLRVIDGNRRLLQSVVDKKNTVLAYVGTPTGEPPLFEHWLPTQLLTEMKWWHKRHTKEGRDVTNVFANAIAELIRDTSVGRREFAKRVIHKGNEIDEKLRDAVEQRLSQYNISLP